MFNSRLINTKVAGGGGGCTDIVDNYDPFGDSSGVALYQLNGNANDVSGNYNGTPTSVTYGTGVFGQAGVFNGSSGKIELPTNVFSFSSFTLSGWVNVNANTDENTLFEIQDSNYYPNHTTIVVSGGGNGGNNARFLFRNYLANQFNFEPTGDSTTLGWRHYAMTYDGSTVNCYINGSIVQTGSLSLTNPVTSITGVRLGLSSGSRYLNGSIDQVRIFNTALDPLEVEALYTEELCICDGTVDTLDILGDGSCIATYQLDGNTNDLSGNYSGTPTDVSYGVGEFDLAGVFNGSSSYIGTTPNLIPTNDSVSVSMWIKSNVGGALLSRGVVSTGGNSVFGIGLFLDKVDPTYKLTFYRGTGNSSAFFVQLDATNYNEADWNHICYTYNYSNSLLEFYCNGVSMGSGNTTFGTVAYNSSYDSGVHTIGNAGRGTLSPSWFDGEIDQVRIFNKALNSTEVTTLYNETGCASKINLDRDPVRHWGLDNTLASTKSGYSALQKTSATYSTGRFGAALNFNRGETASETSTFYGDIWTDVTKANFLQGSVSFWFKPGSINQRNIVTYCEKIPPFGLEFSTGNQLSITSFLDTNTYSPETYGTSDIIFVCITAYRTGGVGSTQTCNFTMYYSSVSENSLKSISNSGTSTESTYTGTFCLGHGAASVGFDGWIDQFRLFDKPLNAEQVQALFDEQPY